MQTMTLRRLTSIIVALFCLTSLASSQMRRLNLETGQSETLQYLIGGYVALGLNFQETNFGALPGFPSCCASYGNTTSLGPAFGASFELPLTEVFRLQGRLGYSSLSGLLRSIEQIGNEPILTDGPAPVEERQPVNVEHTLDASLPMIILEPTIGFRVLDLLWISGGVRAGYLLASSFDQKETLIEPAGYTFLDGSTIRNAAQDDIPNVNAIQLHGVVGLGYELMTRSGISIMPEVRYYLPLTKVSDVDWQVQTFTLGVNVRFGKYTPVDATIIGDTIFVRDTVIAEKTGLLEPRITLKDTKEDSESRREGDIEYQTTTIRESYLKEVPRPFNPGLRSSIIARRADGTMGPLNVLRVEELDVIESYPLLPQIFFPESSSDFASTQQIRMDPNETRDFRPSDLSRDQIDVYRNLANVIGYRMRLAAKSTLAVSGHVSNVGPEQNNRELSRARAESVKSYLVSAWGIEPERISIKGQLLPSEPANPTTPDGRGENQRAEISTNDPTILEPVEFRDKDLVIAPSELILRPEVTDAEGVRDWSVRMTQGDREMYRSQGEGAPKEVPYDPVNAEVKPKKDQPIISTYTVRDANGLSASASDTMSVDYITLQTMKARQEEGKMVERYSLIVFDFNSAQLNASNQRIMERVKQRIQPDSKVRQSPAFTNLVR
ncbi:MAG: OmpA family protein [Candidatus Kapabacteria bacterium]|nr:OmpA family protein [Candidatus Kapabacteria bacterium]